MEEKARASRSRRQVKNGGLHSFLALGQLVAPQPLGEFPNGPLHLWMQRLPPPEKEKLRTAPPNYTAESGTLEVLQLHRRFRSCPGLHRRGLTPSPQKRPRGPPTHLERANMLFAWANKKMAWNGFKLSTGTKLPFKMA